MNDFWTNLTAPTDPAEVRDGDSSPEVSSWIGCPRCHPVVEEVVADEMAAALEILASELHREASATPQPRKRQV